MACSLRSLLCLLLVISTCSTLKFTSPLEDSFVLLDKPFWWTCSVDRTEPLLSLSFLWRFNGGDLSLVSGVVDHKNGTLYFPKVERSNLGVYTCVATDEQEFIKSSARLAEAFASSTLSLDPPDLFAYLGSVAIFDCKLNAAPPATFSWKLKGVEIIDGAKFKTTSITSGHSMLQVYNVSYSDNGLVTCQATQLTLPSPLTAEASLLVYGIPVITEVPRSQSIPISYTVHFRCPAVSVPKATVSWTFQTTTESGAQRLRLILNSPQTPTADRLDGASSGQTVMSINDTDGTLTVTNLKEENKGVYSCTWTNKYGVATAEASLQVSGQPKPPLMYVFPKDVTVTEGASFTMECSGVGHPEPVVEWISPRGEGIRHSGPLNTENGRESSFLARASVSKTGELKVGNVSRLDIGYYTCRFFNKEGVVDADAFLDVLFPPHFTVSPHSLTIESGSALTLPCSATSNPKSSIVWFVPFWPDSINSTNADELKNLQVDSNGTLRVFTTGREQHGAYTCIASNKIGQTNATCFVSVMRAPVFTSPPVSLGVVEGDTVQMTCQADSHPQAKLEWHYKYMVDPSIKATDVQNLKNYFSSTKGVPDIVDLSLLEKNDRFTLFDDGKIIIENVRERDAGLYVCVASNDVGTTSAPSILRVITFPRFHIVPEDQNVVDGQTVYLDCYADGIPVPSQRWLFNKGRLASKPTHKLFNNGSLHISNLQKNEVGVYTCLATNQAGQRSVSARLVLFNKPILNTPPVSVSVVRASSVQLPCVGESPLQMTTSWYLSNSSGDMKELLGEITNSGADPTAGVAVLDETAALENLTTTMQVTNEGSLYIPCVETEHSDWYVCKLENKDGVTVSEPAYLTMNYHPKEIKLSFPSDAQSGATVVLTCELKGSPAPEVHWITPKKLVLNKDRALDFDASFQYSEEQEDVTRVTLTLHNAQNELHGGTWACVGCNYIGCILGEAELDLTGRPIVRKITSTTSSEEISISCLSSGSPRPEITYYLENSLVQESTTGHRVEEEVLYIKEGNKQTEYSCKARNRFGSDAVSFYLPGDVTITSVTPTSDSFRVVFTTEISIVHLLPTAVLLEYRPDSDESWDNVSHTFVTDLDKFLEVQKNKSRIDPTISCKKRNDLAVVRAALSESREVPSVDVSVTSTGTTFLYSITSDIYPLKPHTFYTVRVKLINVLGPGPASPVVRVMTLSAPPDPPQDVFISVNDKSAHVTWALPDFLNGRPEDIITTVLLLAADSSAIEQEAFITSSSKSETTFQNLNLGQHKIEIYTKNTQLDLESVKVTMTFTVLESKPKFIPEIDEAIPLDAYTITLSWKLPQNPGNLIPPVSGFVLELARSDSDEDSDQNSNTKITVVVDDTSTSSWTFKNLQEHQEYAIRIASRNVAGVGPFSTPAYIVKTPYSKFSDLVFTAKDGLGHGMTWRLLGIILICVCGAIILFVIAVVLSYQIKLARSKSVDLDHRGETDARDQDRHIGEGETMVEANDDVSTGSGMQIVDTEQLDGFRNSGFVLY